jgi:hypothetical protein
MADSWNLGLSNHIFVKEPKAPNFFLPYFTNVRKKLVFRPDKPLQPSVMLVSKAGAYPSGVFFRWSSILG